MSKARDNSCWCLSFSSLFIIRLYILVLLHGDQTTQFKVHQCSYDVLELCKCGTCRGVYASTVELEADIDLVNKIVTHLIRHGVLQEAFKPPQLPDESAAAYKRRCHKERELCISPNLVAE